MVKEKINFRGVNDGIYVIIEGDNFQKITEALDKKLAGARDFYRGAKLLSIKSDGLSNLEKLDLTYSFKYKYGFKLSDESLEDLVREEEEVQPVEEVVEDAYNESSTKFINRTVRSGQIIEHDGSIVVIGDVNPGAVIHAKYNIIVLGSFRGVGYAGEGDRRSIVAAYKLNPTQLKIDDKIARAPDEKYIDRGDSLPEVARIIDNKLVIEPYLPNK